MATLFSTVYRPEHLRRNSPKEIVLLWFCVFLKNGIQLYLKGLRRCDSRVLFKLTPNDTCTCITFGQTQIETFQWQIILKKQEFLNTLIAIYLSLDAKWNSYFFCLSTIKCFQTLPIGSRKCDFNNHVTLFKVRQQMVFVAQCLPVNYRPNVWVVHF